MVLGESGKPKHHHPVNTPLLMKHHVIRIRTCTLRVNSRLKRVILPPLRAKPLHKFRVTVYGWNTCRRSSHHTNKRQGYGNRTPEQDRINLNTCDSSLNPPYLPWTLLYRRIWTRGKSTECTVLCNLFYVRSVRFSAQRFIVYFWILFHLKQIWNIIVTLLYVSHIWQKLNNNNVVNLNLKL